MPVQDSLPKAREEKTGTHPVPEWEIKIHTLVWGSPQQTRKTRASSVPQGTGQMGSIMVSKYRVG